MKKIRLTILLNKIRLLKLIFRRKYLHQFTVHSEFLLNHPIINVC